MKLVVGVLTGIAVTLAVAVSPAAAHQTLVNNGVAVTLHVNPDDEPVVGVPTTLWIVRMKVRNGTFSWATCGCHFKVFDSSGHVLLDANVRTPKTPITFPEAKAYGITFSGRVKRKVGKKTFKVTFALRAVPQQ